MSYGTQFVFRVHHKQNNTLERSVVLAQGTTELNPTAECRVSLGQAISNLCWSQPGARKVDDCKAMRCSYGSFQLLKKGEPQPHGAAFHACVLCIT